MNDIPKKIALVHLYTQGYTDETLTNFSLELTSPSVVLEQEKIELEQKSNDKRCNVTRN